VPVQGAPAEGRKGNPGLKWLENPSFPSRPFANRAASQRAASASFAFHAFKPGALTQRDAKGARSGRSRNGPQRRPMLQIVGKPFFSFALLCEPGGLPASRLCVHGVPCLNPGALTQRDTKSALSALPQRDAKGARSGRNRKGPQRKSRIKMVGKPFFSFALLCEPGGLPASRLCVHGVPCF